MQSRFSWRVLWILAVTWRMAAAAPLLPGVGAAMDKVIAEHEVAGAVTLVATRDKVVHLQANGKASLEEGSPMPPDAVFWIASTTKPFAAVAVLMLQDEGKLSLDDPVARFLPEYGRLKTPAGQPANLRVRDLLTHTSGLADTTRQDYLTTRSLAGLAELPVKRPMNFEPGTEWRYCTSAIEVAGRIVELVSGRPFDEFLRERLLRPLGMTDTTFYPTSEQEKRFASCYARSHTSAVLSPQSPMNGRIIGPLKLPVMPGGGLFSTASDLGRFGQMLLRHGEYGGRRYLSEAAYRQLTTLHTGDLRTGFRRSALTGALGWGLAVYIVRETRSGVAAQLSPGSFGHPGAWGTHLIVDPVKGRVYVLMVQRPNLPDNFDNEPTRAFLAAANRALDPP